MRSAISLGVGLATSICAGLLLVVLPHPDAGAAAQPFDLLSITRAAQSAPLVDAAQTDATARSVDALPLAARRGTVEPVAASAETTTVRQARSLVIDPEPKCRDRTAQVLHDVGFRGAALRTAWAIVMRESGGRPDAISSTGDYGIFQINRRTYGSEPWWSDAAMLDRTYNAKIAFELSDGGRTFYPWDIDGARNHLGRYSSSGVYRVFVGWLPKFPCTGLMTPDVMDPVVDSAGTVDLPLDVEVWPAATV